ncbi:MAG: hypothetical protein HY706_07090 [Candidatus Hydrogenedentes bacterium]|nr:hypothetical protein [Candidatus Hydrogenedentota bacterium]
MSNEFRVPSSESRVGSDGRGRTTCAGVRNERPTTGHWPLVTIAYKSKIENRKSKIGLTLVEVLIAISILIIGIVGMMRLFPVGLRQNRAAQERTSVSELAHSRLDRLQAAGAEDLLSNHSVSRAGVPQTDDPYTGLYNSWQEDLQRFGGAADTGLQRVTFSVLMPDGRRETFVTYIAKQ